MINLGRASITPLVFTAVTLCIGAALTAGAQGSATQQSASAGVARIEIESSAWNGRRTVSQKLVIRATRTGFAAKDLIVPEGAVRELLRYLANPPQPLSLNALGVDLAWVQQNGFTDETKFLRAAKRYYEDSIILDTDAEFKLEIQQAGRSVVRVHSRNSRAYMLPWRVTTRLADFETYDAEISRAISRLIPEGFLNRSRLDGRPHGVDFGVEIRTAAGVF